MKPLLRASSLTGTVWCLTRYTTRKDGTIIAITKHDVTSEFGALMKKVTADDWEFEYVPVKEGEAS